MTASPPSTRARQRRAELLDAAEHLIVRNGYDSVKLRDIAAEVGVSIGLIQHYFPTRDGLMREAMAVASERRIRQWTKSAEDSHTAWHQLAALLSGAVDDTHRSAVWLELCAASTHHPELAEDVEAVQLTWRNALESSINLGIETGEFAPLVEPDGLTEILVNLIDGKLLEIATLSRRPSTADWVETTLRLTAHLLSADSTASASAEATAAVPSDPASDTSSEVPPVD